MGKQWLEMQLETTSINLVDRWWTQFNAETARMNDMDGVRHNRHDVATAGIERHGGEDNDRLYYVLPLEHSTDHQRRAYNIVVWHLDQTISSKSPATSNDYSWR